MSRYHLDPVMVARFDNLEEALAELGLDVLRPIGVQEVGSPWYSYYTIIIDIGALLLHRKSP